MKRKLSEVDDGQKVCSYEKFGFCRMREVCDLFHPTENCSDVNCRIVDCRRRHPQPCKFFGSQQGCSFGNSCKFSHIPIEVCKDEDCNRMNCSKRHPEPCRFFRTQQGCSFGSSCIFDHRELWKEDQLFPFKTIRIDAASRNEKKGRKIYHCSSQVFDTELPKEILEMIFDDQILDYDDFLSCRLVSRYPKIIMLKLLFD